MTGLDCFWSKQASDCREQKITRLSNTSSTKFKKKRKDGFEFSVVCSYYGGIKGTDHRLRKEKFCSTTEDERQKYSNTWVKLDNHSNDNARHNKTTRGVFRKRCFLSVLLRFLPGPHRSAHSDDTAKKELKHCGAVKTVFLWLLFND